MRRTQATHENGRLVHFHLPCDDIVPSRLEVFFRDINKAWLLCPRIHKEQVLSVVTYDHVVVAIRPIVSVIHVLGAVPSLKQNYGRSAFVDALLELRDGSVEEQSGRHVMHAEITCNGSWRGTVLEELFSEKCQEPQRRSNRATISRSKLWSEVQNTKNQLAAPTRKNKLQTPLC